MEPERAGRRARESRTASQREPERARESQREPEGARLDWSVSQREPERDRASQRDYEPTLHFIVPWALCLKVVQKGMRSRRFESTSLLLFYIELISQAGIKLQLCIWEADYKREAGHTSCMPQHCFVAKQF